MRYLTAVVLLLLCCGTTAVHAKMSISDAVTALQRIVQPSDSAAGFHSLEMPAQRKLSQEVPFVVDEQCLRFAVQTAKGDHEMCREHARINKVVIVPLTDRMYSRLYPGDYLVIVWYKGIGKLAILSLDGSDIDPFLDAVRVLSPKLTKIKDKR